MKALITKISSVVLIMAMAVFMPIAAFAQSPSTNKVTNTASYTLTIGNTTITLKQGQKAEVPLAAINTSKSGISPDVTFTGNVGTLVLEPIGGTVYYAISFNPGYFATSFSGYMSTTDLTSGLSGGMSPVSGFSGSVTTSNLKGHVYGASLTGTAYFLGVPVAKTMPNYIVWTDN